MIQVASLLVTIGILKARSVTAPQFAPHHQLHALSQELMDAEMDIHSLVFVSLAVEWDTMDQLSLTKDHMQRPPHAMDAILLVMNVQVQAHLIADRARKTIISQILTPQIKRQT